MESGLRARLRGGEPDAFRALFDQHGKVVYNYAHQLTGDWSVAEDVVSLTFLEAWRLRERLDASTEAGSLRSWLLGIATNVARNVRRANRRHADALSRLPAPRAAPDHADDVAARLDDRGQLAATLAAVARLRPDEREVLALVVWSGLDYAEAAQALRVPVGTVRSRLSRARAKLTRWLEPRPGRGQVEDDRSIAVRIAGENPR